MGLRNKEGRGPILSWMSGWEHRARSRSEKGVAFEASGGHHGGGVGLAVVEASLKLRREAWARDGSLGAVTSQLVTLVAREWARLTRRGWRVEQTGEARAQVRGHPASMKGERGQLRLRGGILKLLKF